MSYDDKDPAVGGGGAMLTDGVSPSEAIVWKAAQGGAIRMASLQVHGATQGDTESAGSGASAGDTGREEPGRKREPPPPIGRKRLSGTTTRRIDSIPWRCSTRLAGG